MVCGSQLIFHALATLLYGVLTECREQKTWNANTNFENPGNWKSGRLPCANDRVIFPDQPPLAVFMPQSLTVAEMILPLNGELIFPDNAVIGYTGGSQKDSCTGQDTHFVSPEAFWYDASRWNMTSSSEFPRQPSRGNRAVPHAFRVPCPADDIVFPEGATFRVHLLYPETRIGRLHINNMEYSQSSLEGLLQSESGKLLFPDHPRIVITPPDCTDLTGCACGNDGPQVLPTICRNEIPCPDLKCTDPIQVAGHCCPMCATKIRVKYKADFRMEKYLDLYQGFYRFKEYLEVDSYVTKTFEGDIQSVFVDGSSNNQQANKLAHLIYDLLTTGGNLFEFRSVEIFASEKWKADSSQQDAHTTTGISSGGAAAIAVLFIVCFILGLGYYIYKIRRVPGFSFARFDLSSDKIELQLGTTPHHAIQPDDEDEEATPPEEARAFDNPGYRADAPRLQQEPPLEEVEEPKDYVENPMFLIFEDTSNTGDG